MYTVIPTTRYHSVQGPPTHDMAKYPVVFVHILVVVVVVVVIEFA